MIFDPPLLTFPFFLAALDMSGQVQRLSVKLSESRSRKDALNLDGISISDMRSSNCPFNDSTIPQFHIPLCAFAPLRSIFEGIGLVRDIFLTAESAKIRRVRSFLFIDISTPFTHSTFNIESAPKSRF